MLQHVFIRHFALIDQLELTLHSGATMITGETGAGKSIILGAIELALGQRASSQVVKPGKKFAEVILDVDITHQKQAAQWLTDHDLEADGCCLLRRVIAADGKSRCYINGTPTTAQNVKQLGSQLINIHGQHGNHLLLKPQEQMRLLDAYASNTDLLKQLATCVNAWQNTHQRYQSLQQSLAESKQRADYLRFQLDEYHDLDLSAEQIITLPEEHKRLASSDELIQGYQHALSLLRNEHEQNDLITQTNKLSDALQSLSRHDNRLKSSIDLTQSIQLHMDELSDQLSQLLNDTDMDPERLTQLDKHLSKLHDLSRKHQVAIEELPAHMDAITTELHNIDTIDDNLEQLKQQLIQQEHDYQIIAEKLTEKRHHYAKKLNKGITTLIRKLGMPKANFNIMLETNSDRTPQAQGNETIQFNVQTNPGLSPQAMNKIASGGELSRISLAIQVTLAKQIQCPTLFFDEVDVGIGGTTAATVGTLLRQLGQTHQIITITHQPQVAASGTQHWHVRKSNNKNKTTIELNCLDSTNRVDELARMLGGLKVTQQTKAHAEEMLALHQED